MAASSATQATPILRTETHEEWRLAHLEMEQGHYLDLTALLSLCASYNREKFEAILHDFAPRIREAAGSSHNHQAWEGGYLDHVVETMNIACQLYNTLNKLRRLPFELFEALEVMFLHDIEKPFKTGKILIDDTGNVVEATKDNRKKFRSNLIDKYGIALNRFQDNALKYVEGVPDSEYTPGERTMGELACFCHLCDIASARLWHDKGKDVPAPEWE